MSTNEPAGRLQQIIYETIPLAGATQLEVLDLDSSGISIEAPVAGVNSNIHNTAFAGSIYSVCALSAWGLMHMRLLAEGILAEVVIARAEITYLLPVRDKICTSCELVEDAYTGFHDRLLKTGRARIDLTVRVQEAHDLQAKLDASVAVKLLS